MWHTGPLDKRVLGDTEHDMRTQEEIILTDVACLNVLGWFRHQNHMTSLGVAPLETPCNPSNISGHWPKGQSNAIVSLDLTVLLSSASENSDIFPNKSGDAVSINGCHGVTFLHTHTHTHYTACTESTRYIFRAVVVYRTMSRRYK